MIDLSLLQPVSWVAAAIGVCVAAIYYIMTLRVQQENMKHTLQTRQTQLFMSSLFDKLSSAEAARASTLLKTCKLETVEDLDKIFDTPDTNIAWQTVWWPYEGIGVLIHGGMLDMPLVARMIGNTYKALWEKWGPLYQRARVQWNFPRFAIESEYLYDQLIEFGTNNPEYHIVDSRVESKHISG